MKAAAAPAKSRLARLAKRGQRQQHPRQHQPWRTQMDRGDSLSCEVSTSARGKPCMHESAGWGGMGRWRRARPCMRRPSTIRFARSTAYNLRPPRPWPRAAAMRCTLLLRAPLLAPPSPSMHACRMHTAHMHHRCAAPCIISTAMSPSAWPDSGPAMDIPRRESMIHADASVAHALTRLMYASMHAHTTIQSSAAQAAG